MGGARTQTSYIFGGMNKKLAIRGFLFIGAVSMIIMSFHYYTNHRSGILADKDISTNLLYRILFLCHVTGGLIAILLGPFQFIGKLIKRKRFHKSIGYAYTSAVVISGLSGLVIAQYAMGGWISSLGFSLLSVLWLVTIALAITKVIAGDVESHRKYMMINYAFTFGAITLRIILLFAFIPGFEFIIVYQCSAWLSWIINLVIVLFVIRRNRKQRMKIV